MEARRQETVGNKDCQEMCGNTLTPRVWTGIYALYRLRRDGAARCLVAHQARTLQRALTPLYVKTAAQEASLSCWRVRKSLMTR